MKKETITLIITIVIMSCTPNKTNSNEAILVSEIKPNLTIPKDVHYLEPKIKDEWILELNCDTTENKRNKIHRLSQ